MIFVIASGIDAETGLRILQKKLQREAIFREMRVKRHHETRAQKKLRKLKESERRRKKATRKQNISNNSGMKNIILFLSEGEKSLY